MAGNLKRRVERLERETGSAKMIELRIETGVRRGDADDGIVISRIPVGGLRQAVEGRTEHRFAR